jgi:hypothetical protein
MTEFTAAEVLAVHRETWDMPTFAERHPAMLEWIAERWGVLFPEDFTGQVYLYLVDLSDESQPPVRKMGTTDVRVALEAVLVGRLPRGCWSHTVRPRSRKRWRSSGCNTYVIPWGVRERRSEHD